MRSKSRLSLFLVLVVSLPVIALAADREERLARVVTTTRAIEWIPATNTTSAVLMLQRPDGEVTRESFANGLNPMLKTDQLADGLYAYELRVTRGDSAPLVQSGSFTIANGAVVSPDKVERAVAARPSMPVPNTFFADDVSAAGGVCAGSDCTAAESYGFASIKMKENNTRLKFEDTSTTAGFASTDWQLSANDTTSGGANKFFVEDLTAATVPLLIEGATPNNALYLDSTGRIGLRTSTPAKDLTISVVGSPTIRMEQSTSPFQAWDIVANDANFYVRDVNHEQNPFIIKASAPYNTLVLDSTGRIGMGVAAPLYQIHHSSGARLDAGTWFNASSRELKQDIHDLDGKAALETVKALQPVTFEYKANPSEMNVGFIAEDVPDLVATIDHKALSPMDIAAVLTKVVQQQQRTIEELQVRVKELEEKK